MSLLVCTRPSTLAGALDDKGGLMPWVASNTLRTVSQHPDLMTRLSLVNGDSWKDYKPIYEDADKRGGGREASAGTNIHMVVQALANGYDVSSVPDPARSDGEAVYRYITETMRCTVVASELFLVTIGLPEPCAGTTDLILRSESGVLFIGDTKSVGSHADPKWSSLKWSIQEAIYSRGRPYFEPTQRDQWGRPRILTEHIKEWETPLATDRGVIIAVERGAATVREHWVDLDLGWELAEVACTIRAQRKRGKEIIADRPAWA